MRIDVLDKGFAELWLSMGDDFTIVQAARTSYLGESKGEEADLKLLRYLATHRHDTPFEMVEVVVRLKTPIFVARQIFRSRTFSFNEVSRRYTSEEIEFYIPDVLRGQDAKNKQASASDSITSDLQRRLVWTLTKSTELAMNAYDDMIHEGVAREQARMVLPTNLYTTFVMKGNLRNWIHFLGLRADSHAQWETQQYAWAILEILKTVAPHTIALYQEMGRIPTKE